MMVAPYYMYAPSSLRCMLKMQKTTDILFNAGFFQMATKMITPTIIKKNQAVNNVFHTHYLQGMYQVSIIQ